jgi:hypothetical protein
MSNYMHLSEEEAILTGFALRGFAKGIETGINLKDVKLTKEGVEVFYELNGKSSSDYFSWAEWGPKLMLSYISAVDANEMRRMLGN